jgi:multiple antibiotic resistance protein
MLKESATMANSLFKEFMGDFITLLVVIDPFGTVPLLAAATHNTKEDARKKLVLRAVFIATCVLMGFAVFGNLLLGALGIAFSSFRIAGGIILFLVGLQMVFADHSAEFRAAQAEQPGRDLAVFPIALPYIAGPGAMLAVMVEMRNLTESTAQFAVKISTLLLVMLVTLVTLLFTTKLHKLMGRTGGEVIGRVMGILLAALAAESVIRGLFEALGQAPL